jgi:hypothetical protein
MAQHLPFHRSAKGTAPELPPAAMHVLADGQATPAGLLYRAPAGSCVASAAHVVPFHCSAKVTHRCRPALAQAYPIAWHIMYKVFSSYTSRQLLLTWSMSTSAAPRLAALTA